MFTLNTVVINRATNMAPRGPPPDVDLPQKPGGQQIEYIRQLMSRNARNSKLANGQNCKPAQNDSEPTKPTCSEQTHYKYSK